MDRFDHEGLRGRSWDPAAAPVAGPDRRLLGFLVDAAILIVLSLPAVIFLVGVETDAGELSWSGITLALEVITGVYYVGFTGLRGQTPGKMIIRTRVVDVDRGEVPSWLSAFLRWAVPAAVGAVPVLGVTVILIYAWLLWDGRRQGIHDKAARTLVIDLAAPR